MDRQVVELGRVLGLDESFVNAVSKRGQTAIIDRVQYVDATGAHGRLLSIVQQYGAFLDEKLMQHRPAAPTEQAAAVAQIAALHGVVPELALQLVGGIQETFQIALMKIEEGNQDANTDVTRPTDGATE